MKMLFKMSLSVLLIGLSLSTWAHNKVVVIPLELGSSEAKNLSNVVYVDKKNGEYQDIQQAIDSITNASATNPYMVLVGPGEFVVKASINVGSHISLFGAGKDLTTIKAKNFTSASDEAVIVKQGSGSTSIKNLTIRNEVSGRSRLAGIVLEDGGHAFEIENVNVFVGQSSSSVGFVNYDGVNKLKVESSEFDVRSLSTSSSRAIGLDVFEVNQDFTLDNSSIRVSGFGNQGQIIGVRSNNDFVTIKDTKISTLGGAINVGVEASTSPLNDGFDAEYHLNNVSLESNVGVKIGSPGTEDAGPVRAFIVASKVQAAVIAGGTGSNGVVKCLSSHDGVNEIASNCGVE